MNDDYDARRLAMQFKVDEYTTDMFKRIAYASTQLMPRNYQVESFWPIIRSILYEEGKTFYIWWPRQSGKSTGISEVISQLAGIIPLFFADKFPHLSKGLNVGVFAPTDDKAMLLSDKMKERLTSWVYRDVFGILADVNNHKHFKLNIGSHIFTGTASKNAKCVEGNTLHVCIIDEAQQVSDFRIKKSIRPQLASTNGTMIYVFTASEEEAEHGLVYIKCMTEDERRDKGLKPDPNFIVVTLNDIYSHPGTQKYRKWVNKEIADFGRGDESIQSQFFGVWNPLGSDVFMSMKVLRRCKRGKLSETCDEMCVAAIDPAEVLDATVVGVARIRDKQIIAFLELEGDNYPEQDILIREFLEGFNIVQARGDNTGPGRVLFQYLQKKKKLPDGKEYSGLKYLIPVNTTSDYRDESFRNMKRQIRKKFIRYPIDDSPLILNFELQITGLVKRKVGNKIRVDHPNKRGKQYRSDYADVTRLLIECLEDLDVGDLSDLEDDSNMISRGEIHEEIVHEKYKKRSIDIIEREEAEKLLSNPHAIDRKQAEQTGVNISGLVQKSDTIEEVGEELIGERGGGRREDKGDEEDEYVLEGRKRW